MNVRLCSDLHLEFHRDGGRGFVDGLDSADADVVVLAGDVADAPRIRSALKLLADHFAPTPVVRSCWLRASTAAICGA